VGQVKASPEWRNLWQGNRIVVIDTETTGTEYDSRLLAVACYCMENGATVESWSTLVNPGTIGATDIHGLDPEKLAQAKPFTDHAEHLRSLLTHPTKNVYLLGHNIPFDAQRLVYEYALLGEEMPPVTLLDTKTLAPAAGYGSGSDSLPVLAKRFGLSNPAQHEANADALITREVALLAIDALFEAGHTNLTEWARGLPSITDISGAWDPDAALDPEHQARHSMPLTTKADKDKSLGPCLVESCARLNHRIEDGLTGVRAAHSLYDWALDQLQDPTLTRYQRGLLADGAARVLGGWRDQNKRHNPAAMYAKAFEVLTTYTAWVPCTDPADACDQCQAERYTRCRFVKVPRALAWDAMFNREGQVPKAAAHAFLYGTRSRPCGATSWYAQWDANYPDAALRGAVVAARTLRQLRAHDDARAAMTHLWNLGLRAPGLTEMRAALAEDERDSIDRLDAYMNAALICQDGLLAGAGGNEWDRVAAKFTRLTRRIQAQLRPPAKEPYNRRPAHASRFVKP
jgi:DNA polymerase III epsilon subunit-like protein